jgi:general secretion pathway protein E
VGEIRDMETAQIAVQAGLTGHFVISTIHSGTACGVFTRLLDMGIEPFLLSSSMLGILAQRLVRKLCADCRKQDAQGKWHAVGCPKCSQVGYLGRTGIYELLEVDEPIRTAIHNRESEHKLRERALAIGFRPLSEDGQRWVKSGVTTEEELLRVTRER